MNKKDLTRLSHRCKISRQDPNRCEQTFQLVPAVHYHLTGDHFHSAYQADHFAVLDEFCRQPVGFFRLGVGVKYADCCPCPVVRRNTIIIQKTRHLLDHRHKILVHHASHLLNRVRLIDSDACVHMFIFSPFIPLQPATNKLLPHT